MNLNFFFINKHNKKNIKIHNNNNNYNNKNNIKMNTIEKIIYRK